MTRYRIFGEDSPCMEWFRLHPDLPSTEWVQSDVDTMLHRYKTEVDSIGTRQLQLMMHVEIKTRGGSLRNSQKDTLWKTHRFLTRGNGTLEHDGYTLKHFGVSVLFLENKTPADSQWIRWGRFSDDEPTGYARQITIDRLLQLVHFDCHPDNFEPLVARRHHKTVALIVQEETPLGFTIEKNIVQRS